MTQENIKTKKGFTIIEVVLVLAIAGLIFLMVFVALPALQRSQRDTQRRDDMARFLSQVTQYQANNKGGVPKAYGTGESAVSATDAWNEFVTKYLSTTTEKFADPDGEPYVVGNAAEVSETYGSEALGWDGDKHKIYVYIKAECDGENAKTSSGSNRIAIRYKLERAGTYCGNV